VDDTWSDEELAALALAADPELPLDDDAVPLALGDRTGSDPLLPSWYMPAPAGSPVVHRGWRRRVAIVVILAFLLINAAGLCSTYGPPFAIG